MSLAALNSNEMMDQVDAAPSAAPPAPVDFPADTQKIVAVASDPTAVTTPAAIAADPTEAPPQSVSSNSGATPASEEVVAELLRPMLRQWLDDNMPRIVEKALRSGLDNGPKSS
jgi:cell pole-organizing protein PopZ